MAESTVPLTARVPEEERDAVEELAEERAKSKSAMTRELVQAGLESIESDEGDPTPSRSVSPITILGVVALAIAPTLLATGYTGLGLAAGGVAAVYVLLWATAYDVVLEEALNGARDELAEAGGVVGFFRYVMVEDRLVDDPDTLVERAANWDLVGLGVLVAGVVVGLPLAALAAFGYLKAFAALLGPTGSFAYLVALVGLGYLAALFFGISAVASLAIAAARGADEAPDTAAGAEASK